MLYKLHYTLPSQREFGPPVEKRSLLPDKHLDFSLTLVLFKFPDVEWHGRWITLALFSHQKKDASYLRTAPNACSLIRRVLARFQTKCVIYMEQFASYLGHI